ncbi:MAG: hypothetical protein ABI542_00300 [Gemmatimonadota bacterium]
MRILLGLFWALVGGVMGFVVGAGGAAAYASAANMSEREGARGYFVVAFGLVGAIVGIITAIVRYGRSAPKGQGAAYTGSGVAGIVGLAAVIVLSVWAYMQLIEKPLEYGNAQANLEMEFRVSTADISTTATGDWLNVEVQTAKNRPVGDVGWSSRRVEGDRTIVPVVQGPLYRAGSRMIVVSIGDQQVESFMPPMKRTPDPKADWSEWYRPRSVEPPYGVTPTAPLKAVLELRYRVRAWGE